jgi:hypothetical protein
LKLGGIDILTEPERSARAARAASLFRGMLGGKQARVIAMSDLRFEEQPNSGNSVTLTPSGLETTPYCVTVIQNGELVKQLNYTLKNDAQHAFDEETRAMTNASRS